MDRRETVSYTHLDVYKRQLQNIHEFEADEMVIKEGVDAKLYQLLLIKKAVGTRLYSMAVSYTHLDVYKRQGMSRRHSQADGTYVGECGGFVERGWLYV